MLLIFNANLDDLAVLFGVSVDLPNDICTRDTYQMQIGYKSDVSEGEY
jgi:hypothetical protein